MKAKTLEELEKEILAKNERAEDIVILFFKRTGGDTFIQSASVIFRKRMLNDKGQIKRATKKYLADLLGRFPYADFGEPGVKYI